MFFGSKAYSAHVTVPTDRSAQPDQEAIARLDQMIDGGRIAFLIATAAELRLPDLLANGPRTATELAGATATHPSTLGRFLRALEALGMVTTEGDTYALTPLGSALRSDRPERLDLEARYWGSEAHWRPWGHLLDSIRTGEAAFPGIFGMSRWEYQQGHSEFDDLFNALMTRGSQTRQDAILGAYDFSRFGTVADIGGGRGQLLGAILQRYPALHGILFDQPHVLSGAAELLARLGVDDRCTLIPGSFFVRVPSGADAYMLKFILHDWDDDAAASILQTVARAMQPGATLLVIDRVLPDDAAPPLYDTLMDLHMLVLFAGKERTASEFRRLYEQTGFRLTRILPTSGDLSLIEGERQ
jgi:hypothetical protein